MGLHARVHAGAHRGGAQTHLDLAVDDEIELRPDHALLVEHRVLGSVNRILERVVTGHTWSPEFQSATTRYKGAESPHSPSVRTLT
jgi:hypothetical protein